MTLGSSLNREGTGRAPCNAKVIAVQAAAGGAVQRALPKLESDPNLVDLAARQLGS